MIENEEERVPLTGLDSVIERYRRGGALDQWEYERRKHFFAATTQNALEQDRQKAIDDFYESAAKFIKNHAFVIRVACSNATMHLQSRSRMKNNSGITSETEEFFRGFLNALDAASKKSPV